ncbi:MAG: GNAT family N-acetyltransferase [Acidimicrobiia bacterium]|nr:GNAT family N-acetyltransferase [Acidimicrobiia bacterium]
MTVRRLTADDLPAVQRILYLAIGWNDPDDLPPLEIALEHPALELFHEGWGRFGDAGCVAESEGAFVGGAYYRLFTDHRHGDGYIAPDVPEIAVAVDNNYRGRGVGRRLVNELAKVARASGIARLSLSVNKPNPARRLYERLGYEIVEDRGSSVLMVLNLAAD